MRSGTTLWWALVATIFLSSAAFGAPWPTVIPTGLLGTDARIIDLDTDNAGNVYAVGEFSGVLGEGLGIASVGGIDIFVAKFDPAGQLLWIRQGGGPTDDDVREIEVSAAGRVFLAGRFTGQATFGLDTVFESFRGVYAASLDSDGIWLWSDSDRNFGSLSGGIGIEPIGSGVYTAAAVEPSGTEASELVRRSQATGAVDWRLDLGSGLEIERIGAGPTGGAHVVLETDGSAVCGVAVSGAGQVAVQVEEVQPASELDPPTFGRCIASTVREIQGGPNDAFAVGSDASVYAAIDRSISPNILTVTRLTSTGSIAWTQTFTGDMSVDVSSVVAPTSVDVDVDGAGDIYLTSTGQGVISVPVSGSSDATFDLGLTPSLFVAKLARVDGELEWLNTPSTSGYTEGDRRLSATLALDTSGRLYVGGELDGTVTFADRADADADLTIASTEAPPEDGGLAFGPADSVTFGYAPTFSTSDVAISFAMSGAGFLDLVVNESGAATRIRVLASRVSDTLAQINVDVTNEANEPRFFFFQYPHAFTDPVIHDFLVRVDGTAGQVEVFYDGAVVHTDTSLTPGSQFRVGDFLLYADRPSGNAESPVVSDVRVYTDFVSDSQIEQELFGRPATPGDPDLHTDFAFEEASGATVVNGGYSGASDTLNLGAAVRVRATRGVRARTSTPYLARIDPVSGEWFEAQLWTIGFGVPQPVGTFGPPSVSVAGLTLAEAQAYFFWDPVAEIYYPVAPVVATLSWPTEDVFTPTTPPVERTGASDYPTNPQRHVAGAPVELEPISGAFSFVDVRFPFDGDSVLETGLNGERIFRPTLGTGDNPYAVLHYVLGPDNNPNAYPSYFRVVRTQLWNEPGFLEEAAPGSCVVGSRLTDARHEGDGPFRSGWTVNPLSHYDGVGVDKAYDRESRDGVILPVNVDGAGQNDDMAVAWYTQDSPLAVFWPDLPVRYGCEWPTVAEGLEEIVIASTLGTAPITSDLYPSRSIYNQPDPSLPGFNPNEEHARFFGDTAYALRSDLNDPIGASDPYVLVKYQSIVDGEWAMRVFGVEDQNATYPFGPRLAEPDPFELEVGLLVQAPSPLNQMPGCETETVVSPEPLVGVNTSATWRSQAGFLYARRATASNTELSIRYAYPLDASFYYDLDGDGASDASPGSCVPWLSRLSGDVDAPVDAYYGFTWPAQQPLLSIGQTLTVQQDGLPNIAAQAAVKLIYDEVAELSAVDAPEVSAVRLYDPTSERKVSLSALPSSTSTTTEAGRARINSLPFILRDRLSFDEENEQLVFGGVLDSSRAGEPLLLPNILTQRDVDDICAIVNCAANAEFGDALAELRRRTRNPNCVDTDEGGNGTPDDAYYVGFVDGNRTCDHVDFPDEIPLGFVSTADGVAEAENFSGGPVALTAGAASDTGRVTLAFNDFDGGAVSLASIQVDCPVYRGEVIVLESDNLFEETLTLRHSGDFAGLADELEFEWRFDEDTTGVPPTNDPDPAKASRFNEYETDFLAYPMEPSNGDGAIDVTLRGPGVVALRDNWFVSRYRGPRRPDDSLICEDPARNDFSRWAGTPDGAYAQAQLAQGWIKRVVSRLNPYDARVRDFHSSPTNTIASMITQAGGRFEGPIALNPDPSNLNSVGLIEAYETLLRRGMDFSVNAGIRNGGANNQLLFAATRIADLYTLLGNEASADATDPTIGLGTDSVFGSQATSIFAFQNQLTTPLDEELALLRGRDDTQSSVSTSPFYNKLVWNFTNGDGEVAYVSTYRMTDQNVDGFIDEGDGEFFYPQGHGDAWGHYLSSMTTRYRLLRHPNYDWVPRVESVLVAGTPIPVDFQDERKFARAAATKARTGAEIVNLTYRKNYVEDPAGQWQGYKDSDPSGERAWGLTGWSRRAGQGAYFDWLLANSMLPDVDPNPAHTGIRKIDRTTVPELAEIAAQYRAIETEMDQADRGLNPIGLAKGVVPFDIDPNFFQVGSVLQGETHFEQIAGRAVDALQNAVIVFDYANQQSQSLREVQDDVDALADLSVEQELDYKHRLIELFGTPYSGDIGAGKAYPSGYTGPDFYRYQYVTTELTGDVVVGDQTIAGQFAPLEISETGQATCYFPSDLPPSLFAGSCGAEGASDLAIDFALTTGSAWSFIATPSMGSRISPGEIQMAISEVLQAQIVLEQSALDHTSMLRSIEELVALVSAKYGPAVGNTLSILNAQQGSTQSLNTGIGTARAVAAGTRFAAAQVREFADVAKSGIPTDLTSNLVGNVAIAGIGTTAAVAAAVLDGVAEASEFTAGSLELAKESVALQAAIDIESFGSTIDQQQLRAELAQLVRDEGVKRLAVVEQGEIVRQAGQRYARVVAEGGRILEERVSFRNLSAASTQASRYQDMTFRILRNDALQKFRAQRDLAARYVYLAASAYDYETNLLGSDSGSGRSILADVVRERSIGAVVGGVPTPGTPGLADVLGRLLQNFDVLEGQLGFNNPQIETNRFSLRRELLRIKDGSDAAWRSALERYRVPNLWQVPEFRKYARPFTVELLGPQPALVIPFSTTVNFGMNFFGQQLAGGDSAYDPTNFATKIRSAGIWFGDYDASGLSNTPRVYLLPVGADVMRSPSYDTLETREWRVVDQRIPEPFPVVASDLANPDWIPRNDSLYGSFADVRRFSSFRAYHDDGSFSPDQVVTDTRLIGRSVWNTEWMLIIPGGTLLYDGEEGLETFIDGPEIFPGAGVRTGQGIDDIKLFFETYGYSGG